MNTEIRGKGLEKYSLSEFRRLERVGSSKGQGHGDEDKGKGRKVKRYIPRL